MFRTIKSYLAEVRAGIRCHILYEDPFVSFCSTLFSLSPCVPFLLQIVLTVLGCCLFRWNRQSKAECSNKSHCWDRHRQGSVQNLWTLTSALQVSYFFLATSDKTALIEIENGMERRHYSLCWIVVTILISSQLTDLIKCTHTQKSPGAQLPAGDLNIRPQYLRLNPVCRKASIHSHQSLHLLNIKL